MVVKATMNGIIMDQIDLKVINRKTSATKMAIN